MWQITQEIVNKIDSQVLSPEQRYKLLFVLFRQLHSQISDYDLAAFCVTYLAQYAHNVDPELETVALNAAAKFNLIHYTRCQISGVFLSELMKQDKDLESISKSPEGASNSKS